VLESPRGKSRYAHQGFRVVAGQRVMQAARDIFLGWARTGKHDYYRRQFRDMRLSAEVETFRPGTLAGYATLCGWTLARAHAKAGDAAMISDTWDRAISSTTPWRNTRKPTRTGRSVTLRPFRRPFGPGACRRSRQRAPVWSSCYSGRPD
jgi:hypothetical protein